MREALQRSTPSTAPKPGARESLRADCRLWDRKSPRQIRDADPTHDTPDTRGQPVAADRRAEAIPDRVARLLRLLPDPGVFTNLEAWIRRRLRSYLWRQWQNGHNRFNELRRRGVPKFHAAVAAGSPTGFWRMSGHPAVQQALRNHYFHSLGLPRLHVPDQA